MLDRFASREGFVRSRLSWEGGDLQFTRDPQGLRDDGQRRIDRAARGEEARIDDVKIVHLVRFAIAVERRGLRIVAETNRAVLVRDTSERYRAELVAIAEQKGKGN